MGEKESGVYSVFMDWVDNAMVEMEKALNEIDPKQADLEDLHHLMFRITEKMLTAFMLHQDERLLWQMEKMQDLMKKVREYKIASSM